MSRRSSARLALAVLLLAAAAACSAVTAPREPAHVDPSTCLSGYTIVSGVVVCNP